MNSDSIVLLSHYYPSCGFVIDFGEELTMFANVRQANEDEIALVHKLGRVVRIPQRKPHVRFLCQKEVAYNEENSISEAGSETAHSPGQSREKTEKT